MKPLGLGLLLFAFVGLTPALAPAQTKVAYIDAGKLLKRMPESIDAQTRMDQLTSGWMKEAGDMQSELERKQAEYDRRKLIMTDGERSASEVDLQNLRKKLDDYRHQKFDQNGGELFAQEVQLMKPAYDRLENAIKEAALDGNYDYVFDCSSRDIVLLYKNGKYDLTIAVARKLGIESEILTTPLVNNGPKPAGAKTGTTPPNGTQTPAQVPPNSAINPNTPPQQPVPGFNSGGFNPGQIPPPPNPGHK
jgi:Skp family chaperone for outer membrane proteins